MSKDERTLLLIMATIAILGTIALPFALMFSTGG